MEHRGFGERRIQSKFALFFMQKSFGRRCPERMWEDPSEPSQLFLKAGRLAPL